MLIFVWHCFVLMDDLKVVFYIVVAIIWVVYNNYKKISQASKSRDISKPPPEVIRENWPKVEMPRETSTRKFTQPIDKQGNYPTRKAIIRPVIKARDPLRREPIISKQRKVSTYTTLNEGGTIKPSKVVHFEDDQNGLNEPNLVVEQIRNTDLRKAIILSEILKRPYY